MHRSRLALLVVIAPVAACSTRKSTEATSALLQDSSLAHLDLRQPAPQQQPLPDACGTVAAAMQPTAADKQQAGELTRQAYDAEVLGNVREAQSLLHRASELDATDKSVAYHLGRVNQELGDRSEAMTAFCRYLTLSPATADAADARQRVSQLAQVPANVAVSVPTPTQPVAAGVAPSVMRAPSRVASARVSRTARISYPGPNARTASVPAPGRMTAPESGDAIHRTTADGDVVATTRPASTATDRQPTASSSRRGGLSRTQGAGIGAAAGAIIAGATGHSVKSAVIGAAAGGILGAVVAGGGR